MIASPFARKPWLCLPLALLALLVPVGASQGAAQTGTFQFQNTYTDQVDLSGTCLGATGTITGTDNVSGRFTENGPPAFGFHDHGVVTGDYRIDLSDGRYVVGSHIQHFDQNATTQSEFTDTFVGRDTATLYGPGGELLGPGTLHETHHVSWTDVNGNHQPDPGEVTAQVDQFRLTCG